jgi:hypothetical protein
MNRIIVAVSRLVLSASIFCALGAAHAQTARQISASGTGVFHPAPLGNDAIQVPEIDDFGIEDADADFNGEGFLNRVLPGGNAGSASGRAGKKAKSNPEVNVSFNGLNFRQQRLANNGNQFSVEPPDQALCAGNGFVLESVNDVVNVFDTAGNQLLGVTDLNSFYGYPAAIARGNPNRFGPSLTDPTCLFDQATQRWFHVVLTLDRINVNPATGLSLSQSLSGRNHLDIAVSNTANPLGAWTVYTAPVQDDGTEGTPDHHCAPAPGPTPAGRTHPNACLGDFPHIGADANGFYVTTNEFNLFAAGFHAAQVYAFSKRNLVDLAPSVTLFQFDTANTPAAGLPGFTLAPAVSARSFVADGGGTEYFLSSFAVFTGLDNRLALWSVSNTQALNSGGAPTLSNAIVTVQPYANGPLARQPGTGTNDQTRDWPLGQCIENATCNNFLNGIPIGVPETIGRINGNDSRVHQVTYANGKLWTALSTGIVSTTDPTVRVGIAYFVLLPQGTGATMKAKVVQQGYVAVDGASLLFPATASTESGRGMISFTLTGNTDFPSVAYVALDALVGAGDVHITQPGVGLQDGFTEYTNIFGGRPRWGDYGAAAVDGNSIWFATEYIAQSCNLATYEAGFGPNFGSCGGTRASLGNWATRIVKLTP